MKLYLFVLIFILLSFNANASWQTYQNDLRNTGIANGTGYFPLKTANFSVNVGMDFQPLIADLDANGNNEIVIFSNDSLIIFNPQLTVLNKIKIGPILGQPTLFNSDNDSLIEIVFNSRQSNDYFFVYQYNNSNLQQEFNITLSNEANFSGIKCLKLEMDNVCVFKDKRNYVHILNIDSKTDNSYNTSIYNETRHTVPAIGDIDNDGSQEAVFWFDKNSGGNYGFLAFDLNARNVKWIVDDIYLAAVPNYVLKGQPVLVDLNNDNKLEIAASVFYDDECSGYESCSDWFTELFVYNSSGNKLFSKCELTPGGSCNDGSSILNKYEGTNAFVMDFDKNGIDDICFTKDKKLNYAFEYMALNCYNYSGSELAKVKLTIVKDGIRGTAIIADMNNDGEREVITSRNLYSLDGTSIFSYPLETFNPIAVDVDGNNGLDLVWTANNQTKVFLDNFNYSVDLSVISSDISFSKFNKTHVNVSAVIRNLGQAEVSDIKTAIYNAETLENKTSVFNIKRNSNATFNAFLGLKENEEVLVSVDFDNEINESDEENNFAFKEFIGLPFVFSSVDLEPFNVNSEFQNYIKEKLTSGYYTENENSADVKVYIGKNNPINKVNNVKTLNDFEFGYDYGNVIYYDKTGTMPYSGLIGAFKDTNGKVIVMIVGNEIEGDIIGAKEFIKNQPLLLNTKTSNSIFIDDENADAVKVFDYLHLGGNEEHYKVGNDEFKKIVKNALNDEMFNVFDKNVVTSNGITLQLRNLKPNISSDYLEYLNSSGIPIEFPVVLARGIHSNLSTWETLASEIANEGRDAWLIEITGGTGQDCDTCPNYNFSDLTDIYWPALVNGVLNFTGRSKIQYIGHSNAGRVAIVSLANGTVNPSKIDTLIGVAVPSAFEGYSTFGFYFGKYGEQIMNELEGKSHVSMTEIGNEMRRKCLKDFDIPCSILTIGLKSNNRMSFNTDKQYYFWVNDTKDEHIGKNLQLDNFYIIQGWVIDRDYDNVSHDFIVTEQDEKAIYGNIISSNKKHFKIWGSHTAGWSSASVPDRDLTKSIIKDALNKKPLNKYKSNEINST